jgi:putative ABC transport system permease protein
MIFTVSLRAIARNKTRAFLTCLGIIVGIAAVIAVMAIGQGAKTMMVREISSIGDNLVMIFPERRRQGTVSSGMGQGQTLTVADVDALRRDLAPFLKGASPVIRTSAQMVHDSRNWMGSVQGVSVDQQAIANWTMASGRFFTEDEQARAARVCVLGETVRANLFGEEDPVGKSIRLQKMSFRIIGVMNRKGANTWGQDQDDIIFAPYTSVQRYLQRSRFNNITMLNLSLASMDDLEEVKREAAALLRQRHHLAGYQDDDFEMRDTTEIMNTIGSVTSLMTVLLTAVAAISLVVGGIGIMNIMLVSVTERIREIGLRMAIGATPGNILAQFIIEAIFLSTLGGAIGVALGVFGARWIGAILAWPILVETSSAAVAFLFSAFVGMFFGFYPAWRASKLNPIDCLRYE